MKVVILAGGLGTRLREETEFRPKPMVLVGGRPILWHIMKLYAHHGFKDFIICLGYRGNIIKEYFLNYEAINNDFTICLGSKQKVVYNGSHNEQDFNVTLADTGLNTMTGGRIKRIEKYICEDNFMVTYGDGLSNINIKELAKFHLSHGRIATVSITQPLARYGIVTVDNSNQVSAFVEKPRLNDWVNIGFFVFRREIFEYLDGDSTILEQEPLMRLTQEGQLMAFRHTDFFYPMDTYREYLELNRIWDSGRAPWKVWN